MEIFSKIPKTFKGMPVEFIDEKRIVAGAKYPSLDSKNPLMKSLKILYEDILKNGMLDPLEVSDEQRLICYRGNQRLNILRHLGISSVPVVIRGAHKPHNQKKQVSNIIYTSQFPKNAQFLSGKERVKKKRIKKIKI